MDHMMTSISSYIDTNYAMFGLTYAGELKLIGNPRGSLADGGRWLTVLPLRTLPDSTRGAPFNNLLPSGVKGERFLTVVEFECKMRAPNPDHDFYWNQVRQFRDKVYEALAGPNRGGVVIPRYDWADTQNPVEDGEIWFKVDPAQNTPLEDPVEDPDDPANKSVFLTYNVHWWRSVA